MAKAMGNAYQSFAKNVVEVSFDWKLDLIIHS
jgi:hypothetical protein